MGYTVKKDGTRAWSTTELNCPQTEAGECVCQDNETAGEQTLFDKAEEIADVAASIDAAGGNATLLQAAKMMATSYSIKFRPDPSEEHPFPTETRDGGFYVRFQDVNAGDLLVLKADLSECVEERLLPYIKRAVLSNYKPGSDYFDNLRNLDYDTDTGITGATLPIMINTATDDAVRLNGLYINTSSTRDGYLYTYKETHPDTPIIGRKLSKIEDFGHYALTGIVLDAYKKVESEETTIKAAYEPMSHLSYCFLKYAYINKGCVYAVFKVTEYKVDVSAPMRGYGSSEDCIGLSITLPKNEIIKAIEQEMMGK